VADPHFSTIRKLAKVLEVNPRDLVQMEAPPDPAQADGSAPPA
jgi:DNA-binding Xre family transcriptional regulator